MVLRYLQLSSLYRVREEYPNPADYVAIYGTSGDPGSMQSLYFPSFPIYRFSVNTFNDYTTTTYTDNSQTPQVKIGAVGTPLGPPFDLTGFAVVDVTQDPFEVAISFATSVEFDSGTVNMVYPFSFPVAVGDTIGFYDPSPYAPLFSSLDPLYYNIKSVGLYNQEPDDRSAFYVGYYLMNDSAPPGVIDAQRIVKFFTAILTVELEAPLTSVVYPINPTINMSIRKTLPQARGALSLPPVQPQPNQLQLDFAAGSKDNEWVGSHLYLYPLESDPAYPDVATNKQTFSEYVYAIRAYDGATNIVTLDRNISAGIDLSNAVTQRFYEVLSTPANSASPIQYVGSSVALAEPRCMEVGLVSLVLPNVPLKTGNRIAFYPYVLVELRPVSQMMMGRNIIYSNNPFTENALFICPISDISRPNETPFIKLNAGAMTQQIKARLTDSFYFRVFLPDGRPFETLLADNQPPLPPNPALQIN